jgi:hypothetical protein
MMIGDDLAAALPELRRQAESMMIDAGELRGPDIQGPIGSDGEYTVIPGELKYSGKARAQTTDALGNDNEAGDRLVMVTRFRVDLPMSAPQAAVDDVFTFTSSALDPQLVGKRFRVTSLTQKSFMTARRLAVEEVQT